MNGKQLKILVVEDEHDTMDHLRQALANLLPIQIEAAYTRDSAIAAVRKSAENGQPFDIFLIDLKFENDKQNPPQLNGDVFQAIRQNSPGPEHSLVIHTSAYPNDPAVTRYILDNGLLSASGPRSVFLPRIDDRWPSEVQRVAEEFSSQLNTTPPASVVPYVYKSCFISYSHKDEVFVSKLYQSLKSGGVNAWYAPVKMKPGVKIHEEIEANIRLYDRFLLVLSDDSMASQWVATEIRTAFDEERRSGSRKLIPIRLVPFLRVQSWNSFNADVGKDMAVELREYFIPDFSHWKNKKQFDRSVSTLLDALET
ncbi:MAG TPA: TIR domain-containing protein [Chthonomonadaceae bacterium]|nr:TIR domain-containing protein [Chthonomonadaceae bacterium]